MAKPRIVYECATCGEQAPKWVGQCQSCGDWNTLAESVIGGAAPGVSALPSTPGLTTAISAESGAVPLSELRQTSVAPVPTGVVEFDRVMGGGLVVGSISLVGGEPGVGKSTLLSQVCASWAAGVPGSAVAGAVLCVSAEESPEQVSGRFRRLGLGDARVHVSGSCNIETVLADLASLQPSLAVIDSIQTVFDPGLSSAPGSVSQVRQCAHRLALAARRHACAIVLVGQVTKDGSLAGPRVLEHLVDTVLSFDGERELGLRVLRALKHRFGSTGELGVFEMTGEGLVTVEDPSGRMLHDRHTELPGSAVAVTVEGRRAVVLEVQGLVVATRAPAPRRSAQGFDQKRLAMLLAVLERRVGLAVAANDVYLSVVGGLRVTEPGADLAVCAAAASSFLDSALPPAAVAIGEVGLGGELRSVSTLDRRLTEAGRLGFQTAVVPASDVRAAEKGAPHGMRIVGAGTVAEGLRALGLRPPMSVAA